MPGRNPAWAPGLFTATITVTVTVTIAVAVAVVTSVSTILLGSMAVATPVAGLLGHGRHCNGRGKRRGGDNELVHRSSPN